MGPQNKGDAHWRHLANTTEHSVSQLRVNAVLNSPLFLLLLLLLLLLLCLMSLLCDASGQSN